MCQYDECARPGSRREFLIRSLAAGVVGLAAPGALAAAAPGTGRDVRFATAVGEVSGYLAAPDGRGRHPGVVVLHGQLGLPDWARGVVDELSRAGFVALAVERFSRVPGMTEEVLRADGRGERRYLTEASFQEELAESRGAVVFLRGQAGVRRGRIGAVGFCGGGIRAVRLAIAERAIRAVVSFYGPPALPAQYKHPTDPIVDLVAVGAQLRAPLQIHYGTADYAVTAAAVEQLAVEVRRAGTSVDVHAYEGATHAFYGGGDAQAASAAAARAAHDHYLAFLRRQLG